MERLVKTVSLVSAVLSVTLVLVAIWFWTGERRISKRSTFVSVVDGRVLGLDGGWVRLSADGNIRGTAPGGPIRGHWDWRNGYFCPSLQSESARFPAGCQAVRASHGTLHLIADRGEGANLNLRLE